ncbi:hypothetical protein MXD81_19460, partial [Microbacteriaceae bacterium K1510]|nr:hypothetical protein [Microbacteriaceae bacterium K1510]
KKQDLQALTAAIKERVNQRFGEPLVEDVLIEKLTFVPKDEVREGAPPVRQACSLIVNSSVSLRRPSFKARKTTAAVINLETDAGGNSSSALF